MDIQSCSLFLRNLHPVYLIMERALRRASAAPGVRHVYRPEVFRADAIALDLEFLAGPGWTHSIPLLVESREYGFRIAQVAETNAALLVAHAYVRYLGDLNGGRALGRLIEQSLSLSSGSLAFYRFPAIQDGSCYIGSYRDALCRAAEEIGDSRPVLDEAAEAFRLNIALSECILRTWESSTSPARTGYDCLADDMLS